MILWDLKLQPTDLPHT